MEDIIRVENQFYVLAKSSLADDRTRVLKYGETFAVFNRLGDIEGVGLGEQGLYHRGTRYLSRLALRLDGIVPQLLRSTIQENDVLFTMDMMNLDVYVDGHITIPRGSLHLFRSKFLWKGTCYERLRLSNFGLTVAETALTLRFAADYADIFQVRGMERSAAGTMRPPEVGESSVVFAYEGRDRRLRSTRLQFSPSPALLTCDSAAYAITLSPRQEATFEIAVSCHEQSNGEFSAVSFDHAMEQSAHELERTHSEFCAVSASHPSFDRWFSRSRADVIMMVNGNPECGYPYAGVPWFSTVFGRDALITAMQCLWAAPWMAKAVLKYLACHQAVEVNPAREAEPGKILHEMRHGEMANLNEVPFGLYYGSVDSTPLFVLLAGLYFERTGDLEFLETVWPNVVAALHWIDRYGDSDGDGFVEYQAKGAKGLTHQGWKDSHDSVFHADGSLAEAPIALCEVQAYVFGAKLGAARIAAARGEQPLAGKLAAEAEVLRQKFEDRFWDETLSTYALALDARKNPCRVLTSNAGHALWTGIASSQRAARLVDTLFGDDLHCGWGVRTVGSNEARYNPMAYHNGSVWPHDNSMVADGLARYGYKEQASRLLVSMLEASSFMQLNRLPELFCGFHKRRGVEGPTLYPVACSPQAWSAGAAYLLLKACLGMQVSNRENKVSFCQPQLPYFLQNIVLTGLEVGDSRLDIRLLRDAGVIRAEVLNRTGDVVVEVA